VNHAFKKQSVAVSEWALRLSGRLTLETNVLVQPNAPADLFLLVDGQLLAQQVVALIVRLLPRLFLVIGIDRTKLAVPDLPNVSTLPGSCAQL
jgi:hypothetical protein